jgi:exopolyphosphatase/guanosine-5'-triphosphate,3'-diphosphate pyrophosphatase
MKHIGIIDIGSNSIRFCTYFVRNDHFKRELDEKRFIKLRNHVENGVMLESGAQILIDSLSELSKIETEKPIDKLYVTATAALRDSKNRDEVIKRVKEVTGLSIEVISGEAEAYYGYIATRHFLKQDEGLIVDLGGGSLELTHYNKGQVMNSISVPLGVLAVKKKFVKGIMPSYGELVEVRKYLYNELTNLSWLDHLTDIPVIAIGGTARNICKLKREHYSLKFQLHGYKIKYDGLLKLKNEIIGLSKEQLLSYPSFSPGRYDTIGVGIVIFTEILKYIESPKFILNRYGIREGIILDRKEE